MHSTDESRELLVIVSPFYNERNSIEPFLTRLVAVAATLSLKAIPVFVDDGSTDDTLLRLLAACGKHYPSAIVIELSRNFGKENALLAGLDQAKELGASAVIMLDSDLQHPPELIVEFVDRWRGGADTVVALRTNREGDGVVRKLLTRCFYWFYNRLSDVEIVDGEGDFRLLDKSAVSALCELRESNRFMKGLYAWVGFRKAIVPFTPEARYAGTSTFGVKRLLSLALSGITAFSSSPLRISIYFGIGMGGVAVAYGSWVVVQTITQGKIIPGYASTLTAILLLGGIQLISVGLLGEYIGRMYSESKHRPNYIKRRTYRNPEK